MILNSKFHDYYDNCLGFGRDKKVVYDRETKVLTDRDRGTSRKVSVKEINVALAACNGWGPDIHTEHRGHWITEDRRYHSVMVIGFCGHLYKVLGKHWFDHGGIIHGKYVPSNWKVEPLFTAEDMPADIRRSSPHWGRDLTYEQWFKEPLHRENNDPFIEYDAPVFVAYADRVIVNPCLRDFGFHHFKDGTTAFQEISAYIAGTLSSAKQMQVPVDDVNMAHSKGFDKHSFRRAPTKKGK